jgi:hypothetical protein
MSVSPVVQFFVQLSMAPVGTLTPRILKILGIVVVILGLVLGFRLELRCRG